MNAVLKAEIYEDQQPIETGLERVLPHVGELLTQREATHLQHMLEQVRALANPMAAPSGAVGDAAAAPLPGSNRRKPKGAKDMSTTPMPIAASTAVQPASNQITFNDLMNIAKTSGEDAARGNDSTPKFYLKVVEAAYVGAIDNTKDKHGSKIDDGIKLAEEHAKGRNGVNVFDRKVQKARTAASKIRSMIKLGLWPKAPPGEPLNTLNKLLTMRDKLAKAGNKVEDATTAMIAYARAQTRPTVTSVLTDGELRELIVKEASEKPTEEEFLEGQRKKFLNAKAGKNTLGVIDADTADKIVAALTKRLKAIAVARSPANATQPGQAAVQATA